MSQSRKAKEFAALHVKGTPVVLYNAWDAGSAKAIVDAGSKAIATSSWSVAAAQGYEDGEELPLAFAEQIVGRIAATVDVPVTVDFEGGYSEDDRELASNISRLLELGVIGINFEDRVVKGKGLYSIERQAQRIAAIRAAAEHKRHPFLHQRADRCVPRQRRRRRRSAAEGARLRIRRRVRLLRPGPDRRRRDSPDCGELVAADQRHGHGRRFAREQARKIGRRARELWAYSVRRGDGRPSEESGQSAFVIWRRRFGGQLGVLLEPLAHGQPA